MFDIKDRLPNTIAARYYGDRFRQRFYEAFGNHDQCPTITKVYLNEKLDGDFVTGSFLFGVGRQWILAENHIDLLDRRKAPLSEDLKDILIVQYYREECRVLLREMYGGQFMVTKIMNGSYDNKGLVLAEERVIDTWISPWLQSRQQTDVE